MTRGCALLNLGARWQGERRRRRPRDQGGHIATHGGPAGDGDGAGGRSREEAAGDTLTYAPSRTGVPQPGGVLKQVPHGTCTSVSTTR